MSKEKREQALKLFEKSKKDRQCKIDLSGYFKRFSKKGLKSKIRVRISRYKIHLFYVKGGVGRPRSTIYKVIYTDAPYNFALVKRKKPICNIAFTVRKYDESIILVRQIQGVPGRQKELRPFRWEKMLLQILIDWAKQNGFKRIDVVRAKDTGWYNKHENTERNKRLYMKYDVTARRMGFKFDEEKRVYFSYLQK